MTGNASMLSRNGHIGFRNKHIKTYSSGVMKHYINFIKQNFIATHRVLRSDKFICNFKIILN